MFFSIKNHCINCLIILLLILSSCKLQDPINSHGIVFLENRSKKLIINNSNKNDVINIFGQPQIRNETDDDYWVYIERTLTKGKFHKLGKHLLKENNVLALHFNKYGILAKKEIFRKEDINKIKFTEKETNNDLSEKSFVQSFLESVKQKMYGNR
tara:strand:+ start:8055 stop:8519 length:465 start_codon:yes stop_codon:yes gene_type:complete